MSVTSEGRKFLAAACALAVVLCLHGCAATSGTEAGASAGPRRDTLPLNTLVIAHNFSLGQDLDVVDLKAVLVGDLLKAGGTVVSRVSSTQQLQYRFVWYDAGGFEVNPSEGTWRPMTLYGRETKAIQAVAPNPSVKDYKVMVRRE